MGTGWTIKGWDISFDLSKPLRAQRESHIFKFKLGCVRTRAEKERSRWLRGLVSKVN